ncbi:hypothetical protein ACTXJ9_14080 [Brachybacterium tyrofermentans]|uniref:hypothetical protein n=1 Tax=Brachybacterium tyrofermentans TaxID=47848 RepID=UPI003FD369F2
MTTPLTPPSTNRAQGERTVNAWYSRRYDRWLLSLRAGADGTKVTFTTEEAVTIADSIIDLLEGLEEKNGTI